jgi:hypothetical protein
VDGVAIVCAYVPAAEARARGRSGVIVDQPRLYRSAAPNVIA